MWSLIQRMSMPAERKQAQISWNVGNGKVSKTLRGNISAADCEDMNISNSNRRVSMISSASHVTPCPGICAFFFADSSYIRSQSRLTTPCCIQQLFHWSNQDRLRRLAPQLTACRPLTQIKLGKNLFRHSASVWVQRHATCCFEMTPVKHRITRIRCEYHCMLNCFTVSQNSKHLEHSGSISWWVLKILLFPHLSRMRSLLMNHWMSRTHLPKGQLQLDLGWWECPLLVRNWTSSIRDAAMFLSNIQDLHGALPMVIANLYVEPFEAGSLAGWHLSRSVEVAIAKTHRPVSRFLNSSSLCDVPGQGAYLLIFLAPESPMRAKCFSWNAW